MHKLFSIPLSVLLLLTSCSTMFDVTGKGAKDKSIYYDVKANAVISTYKKPFSSVYIRQRKNDSTLTYVAIPVDTALNIIAIPLPKDSMALYNSYIWINLQGDHWRMIYHIDITKVLMEKKAKIYSRFTSH
jgi:hypothetical protein